MLRESTAFIAGHQASITGARIQRPELPWPLGKSFKSIIALGIGHRAHDQLMDIL